MFKVLENGYILEDKTTKDTLKSSPLDFFLKEEDYDKERLKLTDPRKPLLVNTGGTISSCFSPDLKGVDVVDILKYDTKLKSYLSDFDYIYFNAKLSEYYTLRDYFYVKELVTSQLKLGRSKFIFLHGTDNIAYFASWIKVLCKVFKFSAVVIGAQRSWEKPNCELYEYLNFIIDYPKILDKSTCFVLSLEQNHYNIKIHDAFVVRKFDTCSIDAFYSESSITFEKDMPIRYPKDCYDKSFYKKLKLADNNDLETIGIYNIFQSPRNAIVLGTGVGNVNKLEKETIYLDSVVRCGPRNSNIYAKKEEVNLAKVSYEALSILINLTNFLNIENMT